MILHLLKLVWHRKRANALVMTEIFFSFLIVFAVATMAVSMIRRWQAPLGYSWRNVSVVDVVSFAPSHLSATSTVAGPPDQVDPVLLANAKELDRLLRDLRALPEIESAAIDSMPAYSNGTWTSSIGLENHRADVTADRAGDDFARVMHLKLLHGRWFQREDDAANYLPLVVDSDAATAIFGTEDAVGRKLPAEGFRSDPSSPKEMRVVGVIAPYRKSGEFSGPDVRMTFFRASSIHPQTPEARSIVLAVRPGTPPSFEAQLNRHLHAIAPDLTFRLRRMEQMRRFSLRVRLAPLGILALIAVFLISMAALGLTGVLWQTVTRRLREIGLRRALGATGHGVRMQVLMEVSLLATMAVILGTIVVIQLPLLGIMHLVTKTEFTAGLGSALAVIYLITLLCGAYPSWLASRIEPAEALRYE